MHRTTHALLALLTLALTVATVLLDRRSIGGDWGWAAYACDFAISGACLYVLVRLTAHVIVLGFKTRARIRTLQGMLDARHAQPRP